MKILLLGGTGFLGPHLIEAGQKRGHQFQLFNRGKTNPHLFPDLEKYRGDRDPQKGKGLTALEEAIGNGQKWDAVIDTSGYVPRIVDASAGLLQTAASQYLFISTLSVFADRSIDVREDSPLIQLEDPTVERILGSTYGGLKALCEQSARNAFGDAATIVRPGLIVGPLDPSDRFTYWPERIHRGGEILAPGKPSAPVQFVDARDLASWCIECLEQRVFGTYNAVGPAGRLTMEELLYGCKVVIGADASFTWVEDAFLLEQKVRPYTEMPLWIPRQGPPYGTAQCQKAISRGLSFRPTGDTIRDTLAWSRQRPADYRWRGGLAADKEMQLLADYRQREAADR
ncbi:MAG: NAD-dependent epimerase/dehydratase family protein [Planctomycetota bacterium]|nr:MAG: NAD-dependent epimerase/dehydratase family protein [Planctomycetota bacterium]